MKTLSSGLLLLAAAFAAGCHSHGTPQSAALPTAQARVVTSSAAQIPALLRSTGTVRAKQSAVISAQVMGRVKEVYVHEGDRVRAGQTLVVLDAATLAAESAGAQAAVTAAENQQAAAASSASLAASTLARYRQLETEKSVSPQEMDVVSRKAEGAKAQLEAAQAQVEAARQQAAAAKSMLGYSRLTAPFAGVVTARMVDPGAMAAPGVPLLQVDQAGALRLETTVDESAIAAVHLGLKVRASIDGIAQPVEGTVAEIVPAADPASHSFTIKVDLPPSSLLRAGMYGSVSIPNGTTNAILVPRSALVQRGSLDCAYVLDNRGIAQLRYVTLGAVYGNQVEVLSGIVAGERLVDQPGDRDLAGKKIEIVNGVQP